KTYIPSMAFAPDGRLFFTEKTTGAVRIMKEDKVLATPFVEISNVHDTGENGMLGITVDPDFTENHFVYLYYTHLDSKASQPYNRLLRYTDNNGIGADMKVLLDKIPASPRGFHSGGALAFGPDDKLYITVGDSAIKKYAQDVSSPNGKVLRINRDGSFPDDNPFPNSPVYTFGHRNMFGIAFNKSEKFGIVTENGHSHYDEVNMIEKGGNYGYPLQQPQDLNPALSNSSIKPVRSYWKNIAPAQAIYYDGEKFPELKNKFLLASFLTGNLHALQFDEDNKEIIQEEVIRLNHDRPTISLAQSEDGSIYYGGKKMYVLETIDSTDKEEILYNLEITGAVDIKDLQLDKDEKMMVIDMYSQESPSIVSIKIPKVVLDGVKFAFAVNEDGEETLINTEVDSSSLDHNVVDVNIPSNVSQLVIFGTSVIPEFPIFGIILILSLIFMIVTFLAKGKELVRLTIQ
ncbi:MAG: PQQ-dependent sugar dehydrogenase, partial [Nitrososphaerales archaeon]